MGYGGGMIPYPSDLTTAQWALIERYFRRRKHVGDRGRSICGPLRTRFFMCSRVASPGAYCREISLHGRPYTITFAFGASPDCGTESTINFGMRYESNEAEMPVRVQPLWIVNVGFGYDKVREKANQAFWNARALFWVRCFL
jgi:hypothetical protein